MDDPFEQDFEDGDDSSRGYEGGGRERQTSVSSHLATMEQIRRKRETSFDIDNIVIPYSTMASARVEKLKYKEIQTPYWREFEGQDGQDTTKTADNDENISEAIFVVRHKKAELEEQARWKTLAGGGSGGQRGAAAAAAAAAAASSNSQRSQRRQDSRQSADGSGCNTPVDPMSPVELEVTTRPSTPDGLLTEQPTQPTPTASASSSASATPSSIRHRRRTSSVTRLSRDRNPSEDMSNPSR